VDKLSACHGDKPLCHVVRQATEQYNLDIEFHV
jgi:hypothetical protein